MVIEYARVLLVSKVVFLIVFSVFKKEVQVGCVLLEITELVYIMS